jgi:hypothetical protein
VAGAAGRCRAPCNRGSEDLRRGRRGDRVGRLFMVKLPARLHLHRFGERGRRHGSRHAALTLDATRRITGIRSLQEEIPNEKFER